MNDQTVTSNQQQIHEMYGSFFLNSGEFALAVKSVQEVVNPPDKLTSMPLSPPYLLGIFNLRGSIVPVVDLKAILKLDPGSEPLENKKIAIVDHDGIKVGLLFDRTGQIFRNQNDEKNDFDYAAKVPSENVISGAIKLDQGKRIIQILDVDALIRLEKIPHSQNELSRKEIMQKKMKHQGQRMQCISFLVHGTRIGINIQGIHEIVNVPKLNESALTFGMCIGVFDLRSEVIPLIDFAALLKYRNVQNKKQILEDQRVLIMKLGNEKFGLLIDSVESIITYYTDEILSLPTLSSEKASMFTGCLSKDAGDDIILVNYQEVLSKSEISEITQGHSKLYQVMSSKVATVKKIGIKKSYITFKIDHFYALGINEVKEVLDYPVAVVNPPGLAKYIKGMFNLRGQMITVIDVRSLYDESKQTQTANSKILIFENQGVKYGMIVDSVESIISFADEDQIKIPEILYKGSSQSGMKDDVKFAVEVKIHDVKSTLLVLNLDPLAARVGLQKAIEQAV
ncbi:MAG: chemotaxis protein CheW [Bdellovibrio sp.]|nr:chemotaxis protein CheW [Bdellovibrio sp.]